MSRQWDSDIENSIFPWFGMNGASTRVSVSKVRFAKMTGTCVRFKRAGVRPLDNIVKLT